MKIKKVLLFIMMLFTFSFTGCFDKECEVSFIVDGEEIHEVEVIKGEKVEAPENPTKNGYTFVGWYNGKTKFDFKKEVKSDVELTAKFKVINYTITLDLDGGAIEGNFTVPSTYTIEDTITLPEVTKTGYTFVGWYEGNTRYTIISNSTGNKNLEARFEIELYDVTLNLNGGQLVGEFDLSFEYDIFDTIALPEVTKKGYNFVGWYEGNTKYTTISNSTGEKNLLAKFETIKYDLLIDLDGGQIEGNFSTSSKYTIEDTITLPTPSKTNYIFVGWKEKDTDVIVKVVTIEKGTIGNKSYKAIYGEETQIVLYKDNQLYKLQECAAGSKVLVCVDDLSETTTGWFKDTKLHQAVKENDVIETGMSLYTKSIVIGQTSFNKTSVEGELRVTPGNDWNGVIPRKYDGMLVKKVSIVVSTETPITFPSSLNEISTNEIPGYDNKIFAAIPDTVNVISNVLVKVTGPLSIEISKTVPSIPEGAFYSMNLESVTFESGSVLETIGESAFRYTNLETITIPASVKVIGKFAFYGVDTLTSVEFETDSQLETIGKEAFRGTKLETITIPSSVKVIGESAFLGVDTLTSVEFESNSQLETIGKEAFRGTKLETITIPSSVKVIGEFAFYGVDTLTSVEFGINSQLETIGERAFWYTKLETITIPSSVKIIGDGAFWLNKTLTSVEFESNSQLETIGDNAFRGTKLETITIPSSVKVIGESAFLGVDTLTSVEFESNSQLETIGKEAFRGTKLETITIPSSVKVIGEFAFYEVNTLTSVEFETDSQLETIGVGAFGATNRIFGAKLETITIPLSVTNIGGVKVSIRASDNAVIILSENTEIASQAFCLLPLTKIVFEENSQLETIGDDAFYGAKLETIIIPSSVKVIGRVAFSIDTLTSVEFEENSQLETIGAGAFYGTKLETITIPSSVKTIGDNAFKGTKLETITIPSSVKVIGEFAFYEVNTLTSVEFETDSQLETIGAGAFGATNRIFGAKLETITIPLSVTNIGGVKVSIRASDNAVIILSENTEIASQAFCLLPLTKIVLEENSQLETIGDNAFYGTKLETITIPSSVKVIGEFAFYEVNTLTSVEFEENSQLEEIGESAFIYTNLETITIPSSVKTIGDNTFNVWTVVTVNSQTVYELIKENVLDVNEIHVLKTLTGTNSYLEDNYNKTESGDYWVYTKKVN